MRWRRSCYSRGVRLGFLALVALSAAAFAACAVDSSLTCGDTCEDASSSDSTTDVTGDVVPSEASSDGGSGDAPSNKDVTTTDGACGTDGATCAANTDCCSGACSSNNRRCVSACGNSLGAACSFQSSCCVGFYCAGDAGCAACVGNGGYCGDDPWCCSGHCNDNIGDGGAQCIP